MSLRITYQPPALPDVPLNQYTAPPSMGSYRTTVTGTTVTLVSVPTATNSITTIRGLATAIKSDNSDGISVSFQMMAKNVSGVLTIPDKTYSIITSLTITLEAVVSGTNATFAVTSISPSATYKWVINYEVQTVSYS